MANGSKCNCGSIEGVHLDYECTLKSVDPNWAEVWRPRPGWLLRQFEQVKKNVAEWPDYLKRAAGFPVAEKPPEPKAKDPNDLSD